MTPTSVVLVDQTHEIDPVLLHSAALALNSQVTQDLPQYWSGISASVSYAPSLAAVPHGGWPVFLVKKLPPGEGGYHLDKHNQPYAKVIASAEDNTWTIDASHEIIEMLVDPFGNRQQTSHAIEISGNDVVDTVGTYSYLVEACDPCEANNYAYEIGGIAVSDFITPHYYDASPTPSAHYSFKGNIKRPRQMLPGGYISYIRPDGAVMQILWVDPDKPPQYNTLSLGNGVRSLREFIHGQMGSEVDTMKHLRRRDEATLPADLAARVKQHRARLNQQQDSALVLSERYKLGT
jgi:hypothetical protein